MKSFGSSMQDMYARGTTTLAHALRIIRDDGETYGFTEHDEDATISGVSYLADPGLELNEIVIAADLNVGNLELKTLHNGVLFTAADILGGVWRNASFLLFRYDWADAKSANDAGSQITLSEVDNILAGVLGEVRIQQNMVVAELRDLRQYLQPPVGEVSSKTCRYRLGDSKCTFPLTDVTVTGTIDAIDNSKRIFRDSSRTEANDFFGWGEVTFNSGNAAGLTAKIESYDNVNKRFTLSLPLFVDLQVGDTYTAVAGCRGRFEEDCDTKFSAIVPLHYYNFGGEPHRQGLDNLTSAAEPG